MQSRLGWRKLKGYRVGWDEESWKVAEQVGMKKAKRLQSKLGWRKLKGCRVAGMKKAKRLQSKLGWRKLKGYRVSWDEESWKVAEQGVKER